MANPPARNTTNAPAPRAPVADKPYILVRSRRPTFRRAGRGFTAGEWTPLRRDELEAGAEKAIRDEPMLEVMEANERDVERLRLDLRQISSDPRSATELYAALVSLQKENQEIRSELDELKANIRDGFTKLPEGDPLKREPAV